MKLTKKARAGTLESGDVLVTVEPSDSLEFKLESPVKEQFGASIMQTAREVTDSLGVTCGSISLEDQGALDCTIRARLSTALKRSLENEVGE